MSARDKLRKAAILGALYDEIGKVKSAIRIDAKAALVEARREHGVKSIDIDLLDGTLVATASLSSPKGDQMEITDEPAFLRWVAQNHPEQLRVDFAFKRGYLKGLDVMDDGSVVSKFSGEVVEHAAMVPAAQAEPTLRIAYTDGPNGKGRDLIAKAWQDGSLGGFDLTPAITNGGDA